MNSEYHMITFTSDIVLKSGIDITDLLSKLFTSLKVHTTDFYLSNLEVEKLMCLNESIMRLNDNDSIFELPVPVVKNYFIQEVRNRRISLII